MSAKNIILLHGWGATVEKLEPLASELKKMGWKVFVPKLPGFDLDSPKNVWGVSNYVDYVVREADSYFGGDPSTSFPPSSRLRQVDRMAKSQILNQVQDDKSGKYFVFGHSFGGRIAIKLAVSKSSNLRGIVLCATGGISRGNPVKRATFYFVAKIGKLFLVIPPFARFFKKGLYKFAREHDYENAEGVMREIFKKVVSEDLKPLVSEIEIPALILWGEQDKMTPISDAYFVEKNLSEAKLVTFESEGHKLPYRKPKKLAKEIDKWTALLN